MAFNSYKLLLDESSKKLLISFGSRGQNKVSANNYLKNIKINQMHWFDTDGYSWYQNGVRDIADDIFGFAEHVKNLCQQYGFEEVFCIGASMGGYAAMAVGALIKADKVIAISPQVVLNSGWALAPSEEVNIRLKNLDELIEAAQTTQFIVIASSELVDVYHVSIVHKYTNVSFSILNSPHNVLGMLKKSYYLDEFLENVFLFRKTDEIGIKSLDLNLSDTQKYLSDFLSLYFLRNYEEALPLIKKIVLLNYEWIDAQRMLALILFNTKKYHEAYSLYRTLNANDPGNIDTLNKLVYSLSVEGFLNTNFYSYLDDLLFFSCDNSKTTQEVVLKKLGEWATKSGNHHLSECVREILVKQYNIEDYANYYQLGRSSQILKNIDKAINYYKKVLTFKGRFAKKDLWIYDKTIERLSYL